MSTGKQEQIQRAIAQLTERAPVPEIDFTQHFLDDGSAVSTQERIVKDVRALAVCPQRVTMGSCDA
jgi:serine/threonine-protein phosphatase 2B catalytic subunit